MNYRNHLSFNALHFNVSILYHHFDFYEYIRISISTYNYKQLYSVANGTSEYLQ